MLRAFYFALHFAVIFLGIIIAIHFDFTIGLLVAFLGVFMFWAMLPSTDQNDRLRRYERQHQKWLRGKNE